MCQWSPPYYYCRMMSAEAAILRGRRKLGRLHSSFFTSFLPSFLSPSRHSCMANMLYHPQSPLQPLSVALKGASKVAAAAAVAAGRQLCLLFLPSFLSSSHTFGPKILSCWPSFPYRPSHSFSGFVTVVVVVAAAVGDMRQPPPTT
jgi:hypothetical protein